MHPKTEKRIAAQIAKTLAMMCVRNTFLERLHMGLTPKTKTGDYSDVKVIDGFGRETPWTETSKINDDEMKILMKQIVNRLYTWHMKPDALASTEYVKRLFNAAQKYDDPELDQGFIRLIEEEYKQG